MAIETGSPESSELLGRTELQRADPRNVDLLDVFLVLARSWRLILTVALVLFMASGVVALLLQPTFIGVALILPPQQQQSSAAVMAGQMGAIAGLAGGGGAASIFKNPGDLYVGILESNAISDRLIDSFRLRSVYHRKTLVDTREALQRHAVFEAQKNGLISITVTDHDAQRASDLANGYVSELYKLNSTLAITEAAQRRVFFDQEMVSEKAALAAAENDLKTTEQKTGLIQVTGQAEVIIRSIAELRAEISSREVELQSMKTFATDQNPAAIRTAQEISSLREQLAKLENSQNAQQPGDISVPSGRVPEAALEYSRKLREVKYHEALYDLLLKQYEAARIDEAKSAPLVQVIDRATPPDKRAGPPRVLIAVGGGVVGLLLGIAWVLMRRGFQRFGETPATAIRLQELRNVFRTKA
jgi:uncharacterized protein involved in exopolysaccharide biosynthesis